MKTRFPTKSVLIFASLLSIGVIVYQVYRGSESSPSKQKSVTLQNWHGNAFEGVEITGKKFNIVELSGKPVIVHFWASWCGPCINEFPPMIRFVESFKGQVHLVALSADESNEDIKAFLKKLKVEQAPFIHIIRDEGREVANQYKAKMLPTSIILTKGLKVAKRIPGEVDWEDPQLTRIFNRILAD